MTSYKPVRRSMKPSPAIILRDKEIGGRGGQKERRRKVIIMTIIYLFYIFINKHIDVKYTNEKRSESMRMYVGYNVYI